MTDQTPTRALSDEDYALYIAKVVEHGIARHRNFGRDFHEDDFLVGASVVFDTLGNMGQIPGGWIFGLMAGRSPLGIEAEPRTCRCNGRACTRSEVVEDRRLDTPQGWHLLGLAKHWTNGHDRLVFCSMRCLRTFAVFSLENESDEELAEMEASDD